MKKAAENIIIEFFQKISGVAALYLFGSQIDASKTNRHSDIDLAVLFEHTQKPDTFELIEIREKLADLLGRDVDLINLNNADPILSMQVLETGKQLWVPLTRLLDEWVVRTITDYADLKEMRKPAEEAFLKGLKND